MKYETIAIWRNLYPSLSRYTDREIAEAWVLYNNLNVNLFVDWALQGPLNEIAIKQRKEILKWTKQKKRKNL